MKLILQNSSLHFRVLQEDEDALAIINRFKNVSQSQQYAIKEFVYEMKQFNVYDKIKYLFVANICSDGEYNINAINGTIETVNNSGTFTKHENGKVTLSTSILLTEAPQTKDGLSFFAVAPAHTTTNIQSGLLANNNEYRGVKLYNGAITASLTQSINGKSVVLKANYAGFDSSGNTYCNSTTGTINVDGNKDTYPYFNYLYYQEGCYICMITDFVDKNTAEQIALKIDNFYSQL